MLLNNKNNMRMLGMPKFWNGIAWIAKESKNHLSLALGMIIE
jgi:hypothetical protein